MHRQDISADPGCIDGHDNLQWWKNIYCKTTRKAKKRFFFFFFLLQNDHFALFPFVWAYLWMGLVPLKLCLRKRYKKIVQVLRLETEELKFKGQQTQHSGQLVFCTYLYEIIVLFFFRRSDVRLFVECFYQILSISYYEE